MRAEVKHKDAVIEKLTHENAVLKRLKFAAQSERFNAEQRSHGRDARCGSAGGGRRDRAPYACAGRAG